MLLTIILIVVFSALSCVGCYYCLRPRLQSSLKLDEQTAAANVQIQQENYQLLSQYETLIKYNNNLQAENRIFEEKIQEKKNSLSLLEEQSKQSANIFYKTNLELAQANFEQAVEEERKKYYREIESLAEALEEARNEGVAGFLARIETIKNEITTLDKELIQKRANTEAAINAAKRAEEMKESRDFYRIQLSDLDIEEIKMLRSVAPYLRDKEPLNKVIWKVYYEKPVNDLIGRVIGSGNHTGIYKITDIANEKCYIGQAVNLADRLKQHIKRGVGAETPTRNKLYPAMFEKGPENFTFEVLEECSRTDLDAREDYFQEFYQAMTWGYSIK